MRVREREREEKGDPTSGIEASTAILIFYESMDIHPSPPGPKIMESCQACAYSSAGHQLGRLGSKSQTTPSRSNVIICGISGQQIFPAGTPCHRVRRYAFQQCTSQREIVTGPIPC